MDYRFDSFNFSNMTNMADSFSVLMKFQNIENPLKNAFIILFIGFILNIFNQIKKN